MEPRLITLDEWRKRVYGGAVGLNTARRWCREGKILPRPQKHGRSYFLSPDAVYTDPAHLPKPHLIERIQNATAP